MSRRAPQQGTDARQHFFHVERLGNIIVGTGIHAGDLVAPALARGENEHRHFAVVAAPLLEHAQAILLGQAEIEHDRVIRFGIAEEMPLLAVECTIHNVTSIRQCGSELPIEVRVIFNDKQAQLALRIGQSDTTPVP